ncbi:6365_t:CDS:2 [Cetraspora pellucida]|uniref:6365_t:CDS:1 n=1 Tax=Cetraspora pellucida TaxID=1433469 RepID=A0A9N9HJX7_9GLOM|nr:6365_t:CDS:2 [Cetraspora pellucida]
MNHTATLTQILLYSRDANHISVVDEPNKNINENEAFTVSAIRHQSYTTQKSSHYRKIVPMSTNEGSHPNQASEIVPAMALLSKNLPVTTVLIMPIPVISAPIMPTPVMSALAVPLPVDILQNPEPIDMKVMTIQVFTIARNTTVCCHIRIKENYIVPMLNSSATISIMSNKIIEKLQLKIDEPSTTMIIISNGARVRALGKIINLKLVISSLVVSTTFQIIKSTKQTLLLEIHMFYEGEILPAPLADNEDLFDNFKFDNENLDKLDSFLTDQYSKLELYNNLWLYYESSAMYLSSIKSIFINETEKEEEVDIFAETINNLEQTLVYIKK